MKERYLLSCTLKIIEIGGIEMYENIYTYEADVKGKAVRLLFKPNFKEEVTICNENTKLLSDGEIRKVRLDGRCIGSQDEYVVYVSENAQWLLKDKGDYIGLYVTEKTYEIITPLGENWNHEFKWLLKKCKRDYYDKKRGEIRLYFYEANSDRLKLCYEDNNYRKCKYSLKRVFNPYCSIDKKYTKPKKSCFILGRVRKTIGLNNSKLLDFIEPVYRIELDFERKYWDYGGYEYKENKSMLEGVLLDLLCFCISENCKLIEENRVKAYLKMNTSNEDAIAKFRDKIWLAFKDSDLAELRKLYWVLNKMQDCTDVKFELRLSSEKKCEPSDLILVYFANGEECCKDAEWVYQNIYNCMDANGIYLGSLERRYNFY